MNLSSFLLDLLFPARCAGCRAYMKDGDALCEPCFAGIATHTSFFCGACRARRLVSARVCHPRFPYLLAAACEYHDPAVTNLIHALKFRYNARAAEPLARLAGNYLESLSLVPLEVAPARERAPKGSRGGLPLTGLALPRPVIVPLPLSAKRERERGFNQSFLIAKHIADRFSLPVASGALARSRHAKPQSEIKGIEARKKNVEGCFSVADAGPVAGRNIILVDDVVTSGATLSEAARVLKGAGARRILALAVAKA